MKKSNHLYIQVGDRIQVPDTVDDGICVEREGSSLMVVFPDGSLKQYDANEVTAMIQRVHPSPADMEPTELAKEMTLLRESRYHAIQESRPKKKGKKKGGEK